jgi:hypothetical protein
MGSQVSGLFPFGIRRFKRKNKGFLHTLAVPTGSLYPEKK